MEVLLNGIWYVFKDFFTENLHYRAWHFAWQITREKERKEKKEVGCQIKVSRSVMV